MTPELFTTPAAQKAKTPFALALITKALAPGLNTILSTSVEPDTSVTFEAANVAISDELFGTVSGDQFAALFQLPDVGFCFQVALSARPV